MKKSKTPPRYIKLVEANTEIIQKPIPDKDEIAFLTRFMVQATLPHSNPRGNPPEWYRKRGNYTLSIQPGYEKDKKTGGRRCIGYPYGTIPRLLMYWLTKEVQTKKSKRIELGDSMANFMRKVGLDPDTGRGKRGDAPRLKNQMERLFNSRITFSETDFDIGVSRRKDMLVVEESEFWWSPKDVDQSYLFGSWIELSDKFFHALLSASIPLDTRALRAVKNSSLALDLYAFTVYKAFHAQKFGQQTITWRQLAMQLGADYGRLIDFKIKVIAKLKEIKAVYPDLELEDMKGGFIIKPSRLAIPPSIK